VTRVQFSAEIREAYGKCLIALASDTITKLIDEWSNWIHPPKAYTKANSLASACTINYT